MIVFIIYTRTIQYVYFYQKSFKIHQTETYLFANAVQTDTLINQKCDKSIESPSYSVLRKRLNNEHQ